MMTQDTHNWRKRQTTMKELLKKYHGVLYEERQPPQRSAGNKRNTLHSRIHGVINCKLHPLNKEEEDRIWQFIKEEQEEGYICPEMTPAKERKIIMGCRRTNTFVIRSDKAMVCKNTRLPMDKELPKPDGNWRHRNTRTTREDRCKVTTGTYTPPMMRLKSMGAPLHLQRKLKPYQSNPKWVRNEEGRYRKAHAPNVTNVDAADIKVSTTETIGPKMCCWFCNTEGHVEENCQKFKASKDREKSTLPQKTRIQAATNQRNKEEKEVSKSIHATKAHARRSKKKTLCKQTQKCIDALDGPTDVINKLTLAQTDKSPEPETDTSPYAANAISSQEDYWETDYWETMIQEYPEGREVDQNNDLVMIEHDYTKELTSFYKGLCKLLGEEQTTSHCPQLDKQSSMDSIVKLPLSRGYNVCSDTSLSQFITLGINMQDPQIVIVDKSSNYIEATVLLPYEAIIKVPEIAAFKQHTLFPDKVSSKAIIGKDACLDLSLLKKLCKQLKKEQVELFAHRQADKWAEETNQSVETALRVFDKFRQNNWSKWLPLIHYQTNGMLPSITEETPHESWMGFAPHAQKTEKSDPLSGMRKQTENPQITRFQAQKAMRRARELHSKQTKWTLYVKGQKVWLEGTHLSTSHPFVKLCPKQFGPFQITETLGSVTYRLNLPEKWKIHNTFHATLLSPYVETEEYGVNFTELPPDPIRNKPKKESGGTSLWQQCHDKPREKERQPKISVLENIEQSCETQKELGNKKCIKDFHSSEAITSPTHSYMHGFLHTHRQ